MARLAHKKIASYRQVQKATTKPAQRVVMCYEAVARDLAKALQAFERESPDRFAEIHNSVEHARQILLELQIALNSNAVPELSNSLSELYAFWLNHLSDGNARKDPEPIRQVHEMVADMKDSWQEAAKVAGASDYQ